MGGTLARRFPEGLELQSRLYEAVLEVSGAKVVVDSSKYPTSALAVSEAPDVDLRVLHLVRDPRAVAYSWSHPKLDLNVRPPVPMKYQSPGVTVLQWNLWNYFVEQVGRRKGQYLLVRYEDLVADPRSVMEEILCYSWNIESSLDFLQSDRAVLTPNHMVSGNPARFQVGEISIVPDTEWHRNLTRGARRLANVLSFTSRARYGYE
jgi:hypothetical protein